MIIDYTGLSKKQENNLFGASGGELNFVKVSRALELVLKDAEMADTISSNVYASGSPKIVEIEKEILAVF